MNQELVFAIGTLSFWITLILLIRLALLGFRWLAPAPGDDRTRLVRGMIIASVGAILFSLIASLSPGQVGRTIEGTGVRIPVVWFYAPFWGWGVVFSVIGIVASLVQWTLGISNEERQTRLWSAGLWLIFGSLSFALFTGYKGTFTVFRGAFYLQPLTIVILIALTLAVLAFVVYTARRSTTRSFGKMVATHLALLAGCVVFGLPFAWLLSSSFKEDKDMGGGIVWIPKVTQTVPYLDPKDRQFQLNFEGTPVVASRIKDLPGGLSQFDVLTPFSLRGRTFEAPLASAVEVPKQVPVVEGKIAATEFRAKVIEEMADGSRRVQILEPPQLKDQIRVFKRDQIEEVRPSGLRVQNYPDSLQYLPPETNFGLRYLYNTLVLVFFSVIGTILSCSIVAYAFSRMKFPGRELLFKVLLATMMLPGAVTLMPQFLIFKQLGWVDTLYPIWVPSFFAGAFNVFLLRQFFLQIPMELEDAAKIDGCSYLRAFWEIMMPQVKPALAVVAIWTFMGTWNNFMGPLIYINSPENMPIAYALQLFNGERSGEPGLLMAFATLTMLPVLMVFFFAQKYFIEGVTLSGLGGR